MTTKLAVYNQALGHLGERKTTLSENREPRRVLDDYWDSVLAYCLEQGFWNFAMRTVQGTADVTPSFGWSYGFTKPDDWVRTYLVAADESLQLPGIPFADEVGIWLADSSPAFFRYVSNDPVYGLDLTRWPSSFVDYVELRLAVKACRRITGETKLLDGIDGLLRREKRALMQARAKDAMNEPPQRWPRGSWANARLGGGGDDRAPRSGTLWS